MFDGNSKKRFFNTSKFFNQDIINFILLFRKGTFPYQHMNDWEKFNEILLPEKGDFYSHLNTKDITDADYAHAKIE